MFVLSVHTHYVNTFSCLCECVLVCANESSLAVSVCMFYVRLICAGIYIYICGSRMGVRAELFTCEFRTQQREDDDDDDDSVERGSVRRSRSVAVGVAPAFACVIECLYIISSYTHQTHECTPAVYSNKKNIHTHVAVIHIYVYDQNSLNSRVVRDRARMMMPCELYTGGANAGRVFFGCEWKAHGS